MHPRRPPSNYHITYPATPSTTPFPIREWSQNIPPNSSSEYPPSEPSVASTMSERRANTLFDIRSLVDDEEVYKELCSKPTEVSAILRRERKFDRLRHISLEGGGSTDEKLTRLFKRLHAADAAVAQIDELNKRGKSAVVYYQIFSTAFCTLCRVAPMVSAGFNKPANASRFARDDFKQKALDATQMLGRTIEIVEPIVSGLLVFLGIISKASHGFGGPAKLVVGGTGQYCQASLQNRCNTLISLIPTDKAAELADSLARCVALELAEQLAFACKDKKTGFTAQVFEKLKKVADVITGNNGLVRDIEDPELKKSAEQAQNDAYKLMNWIHDNKDKKPLSDYFKKLGELKRPNPDALLHILASGILSQYQDKTHYDVKDYVDGEIPFISTYDAWDDAKANEDKESQHEMTLNHLRRNSDSQRYKFSALSPRPKSSASVKVYSREKIDLEQLNTSQSMAVLRYIVDGYKRNENGGLRAVPDEPNLFISKAWKLKKTRHLDVAFNTFTRTKPTGQGYCLGDFQGFFIEHGFDAKVLTHKVYIDAMDKVLNGEHADPKSEFGKSLANSLQEASALQGINQAKKDCEATRLKIKHLASQSITTEEFTNGMRSIVRDAPDVGIALRFVPEAWRLPALQVLTEQSQLRSLELDASFIIINPNWSCPYIPFNVLLAQLELIFSKNSQLIYSSLDLRNLNFQPTDLRGRYQVFSSDDINALANSTMLTGLTSLDLSDNSIGDKGAIALAESTTLTGLMSLTLEHNGIGDEGAIALAKSTVLTGLTSLNFFYNEIGDKGAEALANSTALTELTSLNLNCSAIGTEGAKALANGTALTKLTSLNLGSNKIDPEGAEALANGPALTKLTNLHLGWNMIGDQGANALANNTALTKLTKLRLSHSELGDEGAIAFAKSKTLAKLTSLNLSENSIGDQGAIALAKRMKLTGLTDLNLEGNLIGYKGAKALPMRIKLPTNY